MTVLLVSMCWCVLQTLILAVAAACLSGEMEGELEGEVEELQTQVEALQLQMQESAKTHRLDVMRLMMSGQPALTKKYGAAEAEVETLQQQVLDVEGSHKQQLAQLEQQTREKDQAHQRSLAQLEDAAQSSRSELTTLEAQLEASAKSAQLAEDAQLQAMAESPGSSTEYHEAQAELEALQQQMQQAELSHRRDMMRLMMAGQPAITAKYEAAETELQEERVHVSPMLRMTPQAT